MGFHLTQLLQFHMVVQEHPAHNFCQDILGCPGDARIVQQVTLLILRLCIDRIRQPPHQWVLVEAPDGLQQLHSSQDPAKLVLPASARRQQLLQHQRTASYLVLVPCQRAEVIDSSQYGRCQDARRTQSAACGNGRQQCKLYATAKVFQLGPQRGEGLLREVWQESSQCQGSLGYRERRAYLII